MGFPFQVVEQYGACLLQCFAMNIMLNGVLRRPTAPENAVVGDIDLVISKSHSSVSNPAVPPRPKHRRMDSGLSNGANEFADANNSPGIEGSDKLSPSFKKVPGSVLWPLMVREVCHNHILIDGAFQFELHHRVIVWMTPVSQIKTAEDFLG